MILKKSSLLFDL